MIGSGVELVAALGGGAAALVAAADERDARRRGLARRRWSPAARLVLTVTALLVAVLVGIAATTLPDDPDDSEDDPIGAAVAMSLVTAGGLLALVEVANGQRETPSGREVASRWLGLRTLLAEDPLFAEYPPAGVAIWDRLLAYGAAMGVAHGAVRALPLGAERDDEAWSPVGGHWRVVRIRYPRFLPPGYGRHPGLVAFLGLPQLALGLAALPGARAAADGLRDFVVDFSADDTVPHRVQGGRRHRPRRRGRPRRAARPPGRGDGARGDRRPGLEAASRRRPGPAGAPPGKRRQPPVVRGRRRGRGRPPPGVAHRTWSGGPRSHRPCRGDAVAGPRAQPGRGGSRPRPPGAARRRGRRRRGVASLRPARDGRGADRRGAPAQPSARRERSRAAAPDAAAVSAAAGRTFEIDPAVSRHPLASDGRSAAFSGPDGATIQVAWVDPGLLQAHRSMPRLLRRELTGVGDEAYRAVIGGGVVARRGGHVLMVMGRMPGTSDGERDRAFEAVARATLGSSDARRGPE